MFLFIQGMGKVEKYKHKTWTLQEHFTFTLFLQLVVETVVAVLLQKIPYGCSSLWIKA